MKVKLIPQTSYRVETEDGRLVGDFLILEEWHGLMRIHERGNALTVFGPDYNERMKEELLGCQPQPRLSEVVMASPDLLLFIKQPPVATDEPVV